MTGRLVLIETSPLVAGLLPFRAWDALATADVVLARDPDAHPSTPHLYFAGLDVERLEGDAVGVRGMDLLAPGTPGERALVTALLDQTEARESVAYLLGPDDDGFGRLVGVEAARRGDIEVEFVFLDTLPAGAELLRLVGVETRLRDPEGGCPWDLEQDHETLSRYLLEETYELLEAIDSGDDDHIREELGDVLLQVVFHAQVASDRGAFGIDDVAREIADKLVRRHPHVFGDAEAADAEAVIANWEVLKQQEKQRSGPFEGVPAALPGLMLTHELQRKAAKLGFDWRGPSEPTDRIHQELDELTRASSAAEREEEIGDLLGAVVGLARHLDVDPERAMRRAATKFRGRFEAVLARAASEAADPASLTREQWLSLWDEVKRAE